MRWAQVRGAGWEARGAEGLKWALDKAEVTRAPEVLG